MHAHNGAAAHRTTPCFPWVALPTSLVFPLPSLHQVQAIYVGAAAPRITAIKAVAPPAGADGSAAAPATAHSEMAVDFSFAWNSQMEGGRP